MVDIFQETANGLAVFYGVSPANAVYLYVFLFAVFFGIVAALRSGRPVVGVYSFFGFLFIMSLLGAFPLWIVVLPIIALVLISKTGSGGGNG